MSSSLPYHRPIGIAGDGGPATSASMSYPRGVAVDGLGNIFIADYAGNRFRIVPSVTVSNTPVAVPTGMPVSSIPTATPSSGPMIVQISSTQVQQCPTLALIIPYTN